MSLGKRGEKNGKEFGAQLHNRSEGFLPSGRAVRAAPSPYSSRLGGHSAGKRGSNGLVPAAAGGEIGAGSLRCPAAFGQPLSAPWARNGRSARGGSAVRNGNERRAAAAAGGARRRPRGSVRTRTPGTACPAGRMFCFRQAFCSKPYTTNFPPV